MVSSPDQYAFRIKFAIHGRVQLCLSAVFDRVPEAVLGVGLLDFPNCKLRDATTLSSLICCVTAFPIDPITKDSDDTFLHSRYDTYDARPIAWIVCSGQYVL